MGPVSVYFPPLGQLSRRGSGRRFNLKMFCFDIFLNLGENLVDYPVTTVMSVQGEGGHTVCCPDSSRHSGEPPEVGGLHGHQPQSAHNLHLPAEDETEDGGHQRGYEESDSGL